MRKIDYIIVHCSATKAGQDFTAADIDRWHPFLNICPSICRMSVLIQSPDITEPDTSPDLNGDGVIEPYEYVKA